MALPALVRFLDRTTADGIADAVLLARYVASRDEAAFELLVRRHADAVWKVARGILRQDADAEDAFQATFLALAQTGGSVRSNCLAGWLHRVAVHAALKQRCRMARNLTNDRLDTEPAQEISDDGAAVHEELARLPDRYRLPIVLCELEGLTHAEAARTLGWPIGTVSGRLSRARDQLRIRLLRRGIYSLGLVTTIIARPDLVRAASRIGEGMNPSPAVIQLTNGALTAMRTTNRAIQGIVAAVVVCLAGFGLVAAGRATAPEQICLTVQHPSTEVPTATEATQPAADERQEAGPRERALSQRNLRAVAQAIQMYHLDHGHLPTDIMKDGKALLSWRVAILPYMEQRALYKQFKLDEPWDSEHNRTLSKVLVKVYSAHATQPSRQGYGVTYLKRFTGSNTLHRPGQKLDVSRIPDGRMMTLLVVEIGDPVPWTKPDDPVLEPTDPLKDPFTPRIPPSWKGPFSNVVNAVFADGVALSLKPGLARQTVQALIYAGDGMVTECRSDMVAIPPIAQDHEDAQLMLRVARDMANQLVKLSEEETRLRAELAKANQEPPDTATPLADLLLELDQKLRELRARVAQLKEQLERSKK